MASLKFGVKIPFYAKWLIILGAALRSGKLVKFGIGFIKLVYISKVD